MQVLYPRYYGVDAHVKMIVACLIINGRKEVRTFAVGGARHDADHVAFRA